jgi:hypothetical protein
LKIFSFLKAHWLKFFLLSGFDAISIWYWSCFVSSYYFSIPVRIDDYWNLPLLQVEIEGNVYDVELDLGTRLSTLPKDNLDGINKEFYGTFYGFDMHGKAYASSIYQVPKVKIYDCLVPIMKICEESAEFIENSVLLGDAKDLPYIGRLGREMFEDRNFLLDFSQSKMILCKKFKDLKRENYSLEEFTKVPFVLNTMGICLQVETDTGIKTMLLDTGASRSLIRRAPLEEENVKEFSRGIPIWYSKKLVLGGRDFGEKRFGLFKIASVMAQIDGILGMDFIKEHLVYIDMKQQVAYIGKNSAAAACTKDSL